MNQGLENRQPCEPAGQREASLNSKLHHVLDSIGELVKTTNIVSINANISAARLQHAEGRVFEQIAREMRDISQRSLREIQGLHEILREVRSLSELINLAGRQRMLAQKMMKLQCLRRIGDHPGENLREELEATRSLFEESHRRLGDSPLNTGSIHRHLELTWECWLDFIRALDDEDLARSNRRNNELTALLNETVSQYQSLAG